VIHARGWFTRVAGRGPLATLWWDLGRWIIEIYLRLAYRYRVAGRERIPPTGPIIFISNHQSYLDPVIVGCAVRGRQFTAIAQEGLFRFPPFGWLLRSYGTIAISRGTGDVGAMRAALAELAAGRCVLVFPEGTRSSDGGMQPFRRGVLLLQRRAGVPIVPLGLDGASEAWPRGRRCPRLGGRVRVEVGEPIDAARLAALDPVSALALLESEVDRLRLRARSALRAESGGAFPPAGPGDRPLRGAAEAAA
jgi:1-acyl-sn-glycerol-3-phosphate acyltransferase